MKNQSDMLDISTVTATYERPVDTVELVESLALSLDRFESEYHDVKISPDLSFIVVCPEADERTVTELEESDVEELEIVEAGCNRVTQNRDRGVKKADTEYVAILDSDCIVNRDWFERVYECIQTRSPDVIQGGYFSDYPSQRNWITETEAVQDSQRFRDGEFDSRNLVFRRSVYFEIGGYETRSEYAGGGEDQVLRPRFERGTAIAVWPRRS